MSVELITTTESNWSTNRFGKRNRADVGWFLCVCGCTKPYRSIRPLPLTITPITQRVHYSVCTKTENRVSAQAECINPIPMSMFCPPRPVFQASGSRRRIRHRFWTYRRRRRLHSRRAATTKRTLIDYERSARRRAVSTIYTVQHSPTQLHSSGCSETMWRDAIMLLILWWDDACAIDAVVTMKLGTPRTSIVWCVYSLFTLCTMCKSTVKCVYSTYDFATGGCGKTRQTSTHSRPLSAPHRSDGLGGWFIIMHFNNERRLSMCTISLVLVEYVPRFGASNMNLRYYDWTVCI